MYHVRERGGRLPRRGLLPAIAAAALFAGIVAAAGEDSPQRESLMHQLNAAEVQTRALQGRIAAAGAPAGSYRVAALFGESDEEKAARLQREQAQDDSVAALRQRMDAVENSLRRLTGQLEQIDHRINEINSRIERMQKDFDYKLCTMAAQQLGASPEPGEENQLPCGGSTPGNAAPAAPPPPANAPAAQDSIHLAPPPSVLGTLPAGKGPNANAEVAAVTPPPASTHKSRYDAAMNMLAKAQYDEARAAFRSFADNFPDDQLAPQAVYWIGDIAYVQKDYPSAARAFAEEIKKYPDSVRAPESMVKLGQSLIAMGQKQEGCTTLGALAAKYPNASKTIVSRAAQDRKAAHCR